MLDRRHFYINGRWINPLEPSDLEVINPATEQPIAVISMGTAADIDLAVAAAKQAFTTYSRTSVEERLALLEKLLVVYRSRLPTTLPTGLPPISRPPIRPEPNALLRASGPAWCMSMVARTATAVLSAAISNLATDARAA